MTNATWPAEWPGHVDHLEGHPGDGDLVAAADRVLGLVRRDRGAAARYPVLKRVDLARGRPDLRPGAACQVGNARDVVDVAVRDEDRGCPGTDPRKLEPQRRGIAAGVDHDSLGGAAIGSDDVAVRLVRAHHEAVDRERHRRA